MDQIQQDGLFNLTDLMVAATYFSKPHARPTPASWGMADIKGIRDFDPAVDDSYIDVEPTTGASVSVCVCMYLIVCLCRTHTYIHTHALKLPPKPTQARP